MTTMTQHAAGMFCWSQLTTPDEQGARKFYASLFDWNLENTSVGSGPSFTLFKKDDNPIGAVMRQDKPLHGYSGPMWTAFVAVDDVDQITAKVKELGGRLLMEPTDAGENGRMALFEDPTRGVFAVWQGMKKPGAAVVNETGAMCWNELITDNAAKATAFYKQLFGWTTETMPGLMGTYTILKKDGAQTGGLMQATPEMKLTHPYWLIYFGVDDCDKSASKAADLGGRIMRKPTDIPNVGRFSVLTDPQGAYFAIIAMQK